MAKIEWHSSRKFPGVRWHFDKRGKKIFYIYWMDAGRKRQEKVGAEHEGYSAALAVDVRAARVKAARHPTELRQDPRRLPTFGELAEMFLKATERKVSGHDDKSRYRDHLAPRFSGMRLDQVRPHELERLREELLATLAPATVRQVLALAKSIFNKGIEWHLFHGPNPMKKVKFPKVDNERDRTLTPSEADVLLTRLRERSTQAYGLALMAYDTGARLGELFSLRVGDVNFSHAVVSYRNTKAGDGRRVPLTDRAARLLRGLCSDKTPSAYVFVQASGEPLHSITTAFRRAADDLFNQGVTDRRHRVVFHTLRHSFASDLVRRGESLRLVMDLTGHKSLEMLKRYAHLLPQERSRAIIHLDRERRKSRRWAGMRRKVVTGQGVRRNITG